MAIGSLVRHFLPTIPTLPFCKVIFILTFAAILFPYSFRHSLRTRLRTGASPRITKKDMDQSFLLRIPFLSIWVTCRRNIYPSIRPDPLPMFTVDQWARSIFHFGGRSGSILGRIDIMLSYGKSPHVDSSISLCSDIRGKVHEVLGLSADCVSATPLELSCCTLLQRQSATREVCI